MKRFVFPALLLAGLSAATAARAPKPVTSEFFATDSAGFVSNYPDPEVSCYLTLRVLENLARPAYLQVEYENPDDPDAPDLQYLEVKAGQEKLDLKSKFFPRAKNRKSYRVVVEVFADKTMKAKIGEHVQMVEFFALPF
jgi:hypothetical protein